MNMELKIIYKRDRLDGIAQKWRNTYGHGFYANDPDKQKIQDKLDALAPKQFLPEEADTIIGNSSWTEFKCDLCKQDKDVLMRMGEEPDYESRWLDCCQECITKALRKF